jgi:hypothetical protein
VGGRKGKRRRRAFRTVEGFGGSKLRLAVNHEHMQAHANDALMIQEGNIHSGGRSIPTEEKCLRSSGTEILRDSARNRYRYARPESAGKGKWRTADPTRYPPPV